MKKIGTIILAIILLILAILIWFRRDNFKHINKDWRIGIVTPEGLEMVVISPTRRMVNIMKIDGKTQVWIPGGIGWSNQNRVKEILEKSDDKKLINKVFFFNFGFVPETIEYLNNVDDWNSNSRLLKTMGILSWLNFNYMRDRIIFNNEIITKDLLSMDSFLDEVMMRDFADSDLVNEEDIRIAVVNTTQENGLASFLSSRLEWAGASVISATNDNKDIKSDCLMTLGLGTENTMAAKLITQVFSCEKENGENLSEGEIELYFGENFTKVIKYDSYVRTF